MTSPLGRFERGKRTPPNAQGTGGRPDMGPDRNSTQELRDALTARTNHQAIRLSTTNAGHGDSMVDNSNERRAMQGTCLRWLVEQARHRLLRGGTADRLADQRSDFENPDVCGGLNFFCRLNRVGDDELLQP